MPEYPVRWTCRMPSIEEPQREWSRKTLFSCIEIQDGRWKVCSVEGADPRDLTREARAPRESGCAPSRGDCSAHKRSRTAPFREDTRQGASEAPHDLPADAERRRWSRDKRAEMKR